MNGSLRVEQTEFWQAGSPEPEPSPDVVGDVPSPDAGAVTELELASIHSAFTDCSDESTNHGRPPVDGVGDEEETEAPVRPVVAPFKKRYAEARQHVPRFSMTRYLRVNGLLEDNREDRRGMILPRRAFRPRFSFLTERRLPVDLPMKLGK